MTGTNNAFVRLKFEARKVVLLLINKQDISPNERIPYQDISQITAISFHHGK